MYLKIHVSLKPRAKMLRTDIHETSLLVMTVTFYLPAIKSKNEYYTGTAKVAGGAFKRFPNEKLASLRGM